MLFVKLYKNIFNFSILFIILINIYLIVNIPLSLFDQCLNILLSVSIYEYFKNQQIEIKKRSHIFSLLLSLIIFLFTLYKSFIAFSLEDKFIYFTLLLFLFSIMLLNLSLENIINNLKIIFLAAIFPLKEFLFIPLSILLTPISTAFTWFVLNIFGFNAYVRGQEIFFGDGGVDITFACSGSEQIIFTFTSMFVLNLLIPFKNIKIFSCQLIVSLFITFLINVLRLCILVIFVDSHNSDEFSIFDLFHGSRGSLIFALISTGISCEFYKRLYQLEKLDKI